MSQQNVNVKGAAEGPENHFKSEDEIYFEAVYAFLKSRYKPSRFADRDQPGIWSDYSLSVTRSHIESLKSCGFSWVSQHEDVAGVGFKFNQKLNIIT